MKIFYFRISQSTFSRRNFDDKNQLKWTLHWHNKTWDFRENKFHEMKSLFIHVLTWYRESYTGETTTRNKMVFSLGDMQSFKLRSREFVWKISLNVEWKRRSRRKRRSLSLEHAPRIEILKIANPLSKRAEAAPFQDKATSSFSFFARVCISLLFRLFPLSTYARTEICTCVRTQVRANVHVYAMAIQRHNLDSAAKLGLCIYIPCLPFSRIKDGRKEDKWMPERWRKDNQGDLVWRRDNTCWRKFE